MNNLIIVTGAASGIGKAVCKELRKNKIPFLAVDRDTQKLLEFFDGHYFVCDLSIPKNISSMFESLRETDVKLGGLIHCAGICKVQDINEITDEDIKLTYAVNVFSFIEMFKLFQSYINKAEDTRIIALSSITANRAYKNQLLYASSKAALESIVKSTAQAGLQTGIRVNAVELGAAKTEMFDSLSPNMDTITKHYPLGLLEPSEAAEIIVDLLASVHARTTGSVIRIDSGFSVVH